MCPAQHAWGCVQYVTAMAGTSTRITFLAKAALAARANAWPHSGCASRWAPAACATVSTLSASSTLPLALRGFAVEGGELVVQPAAPRLVRHGFRAGQVETKLLVVGQADRNFTLHGLPRWNVGGGKRAVARATTRTRHNLAD